MCACKCIGSLNRQGMEALNKGEHGEAVTLLKKAVQQAHDIDSPVYEAKIRNNLALAYQIMGHLDQAHQNFTLALAGIRRKVGEDNPLYTRITGNLSRLEAHN